MTDYLLFTYFPTCKEVHEQSNPAEYVGPGEAPVTKSLSQEVHRHPSVDRHGQKNKESYKRHLTLVSWVR